MSRESFWDLIRQAFALSVFLDSNRPNDRWQAPGTGRRLSSPTPMTLHGTELHPTARPNRRGIHPFRGS